MSPTFRRRLRFLTSATFLNLAIPGAVAKSKPSSAVPSASSTTLPRLTVFTPHSFIFFHGHQTIAFISPAFLSTALPAKDGGDGSDKQDVTYSPLSVVAKFAFCQLFLFRFLLVLGSSAAFGSIVDRFPVFLMMRVVVRLLPAAPLKRSAGFPLNMSMILQISSQENINPAGKSKHHWQLVCSKLRVKSKFVIS